jgi:hypothetical protein
MLQALVVERFRQGNYPSADEAARRLLPEILKEDAAKKAGLNKINGKRRIAKINGKRRIADWIRAAEKKYD